MPTLDIRSMPADLLKKLLEIGRGEPSKDPVAYALERAMLLEASRRRVNGVPGKSKRVVRVISEEAMSRLDEVRGDGESMAQAAITAVRRFDK